MKTSKLLLLCAALTFSSIFSTAQTLKFDTTSISYENKLRPSIGVQIDPDAKTTKKAWVKFLKKKHKVKTSGMGLFSNDDLLKSEDITIASISDKRMNLYARITDNTEGSLMKIFGSFGYDYFIGLKDYPSEFGAMNTLFDQFLQEFLNDYYTDETKSLSKQLKKDNKEKVSLMKSIEKNKSKLASINQELLVMNASKDAGIVMDVKQVEKMGKATEDKVKLDGLINESTLSIQTLETKIKALEEKLEKMSSHRKGLIK